MSCCGHRLVGAALWLLLASPVAAQDSPFHALAEHLTAHGPYRGPTVTLESAQLRPAHDQLSVCGIERPLCVHGARGERKRAAAVLAALERGYDWLLAEGWPLPYPDGGAGDSLELDVYLVPDAPLGASAYPDQLATATPLDAATAFALFDPGLPTAALASCALAALVEAGLLARDPAEAPQLRHATAALATWLGEGQWGCEAEPDRAQRDARLGALGDTPTQIAAMAQWLAWLDQRHQGGSGELVRELWELAAQHSDGPNALHARPSVWEALESVLERSGETLDADAEELALQRALTPEALGLSPRARVPMLANLTLAKLPAAASSRDPLAGYGSAYVRVEVPEARSGSQLRVWLRADADARWSLLAARLDDRGAPLAQLSAPPRSLPESFLPIELTPETSAVLISVTALPLQHPQERARLDEHHFRLTFAASAQ